MNNSKLNQTANLINELKTLVENSDGLKKFSKPVTCVKQSFGDTKFVSWRLNDFMYKKATNHFPTMARGLFTVDDPESKIAIRGYDKFFNLNEVVTTKKDYLLEHTKGPFIITVKENGCIIFVSSFQRQLIVASKHSLTSDHAKRGKYWLQKHLKLVNATEHDLIQFLEENQVTLCFELCDDSFEEHILPYPAQHTGLHIHGVNYNQAAFVTWPIHRVVEVAERFGFLSVSYKVYSTIEDVFKIFQQLSIDQGQYEGRPIEGVVVRCSLDNISSPFFFKYKLDEPYLLFREFRELTKNYLTSPKRIKFKLRYSQSQDYLTWLKKKAKNNPELFEGVDRNHGVVKCREVFYEETKLDIDCTKVEGELPPFDPVLGLNDTMASATSTTIITSDKPKYVIMTVGTIGCGKSLLAKSLGLLFPNWGHIQSDACKSGKSFINKILLSLNKYNVVIAEKNHHLSILRNTLMDSVIKVYPLTKFIALHWDPFSSPIEDTINTIYSRVLKRGKNHPNLTPQSNWDLEKIIQDFYNSFEPFENDSRSYDHVIDLNINGDIQENIDKVLFDLQSEKCNNIGRLAIDNEKLDSVIQKAHKISTTAEKNKREMLKNPQYYGIALLAPIYDLLVSNLKLSNDHPLVVTLSDFFTSKIALAYHVTLIHSNEKAKANWYYYESNRDNILGASVTIEVDKILFVSGTIVTLCVSHIKDSYGREITKQLPTSRPHLHITAGCSRTKAKPFFSNEIISEYKNLKYKTFSGNVELLLKSFEEIKLKDITHTVDTIKLKNPLSLLGRISAFKR